MILHLSSLATLLDVILMMATAFAVGRARSRHGIKAPATSGHPQFERAYRVQMNTLEASVMFLPLLWLATRYGFGLWAGVAGLVWIVGRAWYAVAYLRDPAARAGGFALAAMALTALLAMAAFGVARALLID